MILGRFFRRSRTAASRPRCRPQLEGLEERLVMNNRFVVPVAQADNVSKFATLQNALTTPGLGAGDVIQIEPGSLPGFISNIDLPKVQNLTIRGDAHVKAEDLPAFIVSDALIIQPAANNLTLQNVHAQLNNGIELLDANATIIRSFLEAGAQHEPALNLVQSPAAVISDNDIICTGDAGGAALISVQPVANCHNLISGNTVVNNTTNLLTVLTYGSGVVDSNINDRVVHNTFNAGTALTVFFITDTNGLDIEDNLLTGTGSQQQGIDIQGTALQGTIRNNRIDLAAGAGNVGLAVEGSDASHPISFVIANNDFNTGGLGTGIDISVGNDAHSVQLRVEGNDFHNNKVGLHLDAIGNTAADIDLGGGTQHSLGGNNFRGFASQATTTSGAIVSALDASAGDVLARNNLFSVSDPITVVFDGADQAGLDNVDVSGNLKGNAALVQTLFLHFLQRAGDLNNPQDAGAFVSLLDHGTALSTVVNDVARSQEALGIQVEQLYQRFLGRDASAAEQAVWISQIQHGLTLEAVTAQILTSAEYGALFVDDSAFVRSLYRGLLHREGSAAEIAGSVAALPAIGRAGVVQGFLTSQEFRTVLINEDYADLLHRAPAASEVNGWLAANLDALTMDEVFATSPEYQVNG
jgi:hypothetical protein